MEAQGQKFVHLFSLLFLSQQSSKFQRRNPQSVNKYFRVDRFIFNSLFFSGQNKMGHNLNTKRPKRPILK